MYWALVTQFEPGAFEFDSLSDAVAQSHLIVRGRVVGRGSGALADYGIVAIDEVLKGTSDSASVLVKQLAYPAVPDHDLPRGEVLLFLKNYGRFYLEEGVAVASDAPEWARYFMPNRYQAALRNLDGVVDLIAAPEGWWDLYGPFPSDFHGRSFEEVVAEVLQLATS